MSVPMTLSDLESEYARSQIFPADLVNNARIVWPVCMLNCRTSVFFVVTPATSATAKALAEWSRRVKTYVTCSLHWVASGAPQYTPRPDWLDLEAVACDFVSERLSSIFFIWCWQNEMYNISSYVSSTPPQLLRCDLWGSFTPDFCCHCYPTNTGIEKYIIMLFISHLSKSVSKPLSCSMLSHFTEICCLVHVRHLHSVQCKQC